jgi:uncharacterized protein (TIGR02677 family)
MYRAIIDVFTEASAAYVSRLSPSDVRELLLAQAEGVVEAEDDGPSLAEVESRLVRLFEWGNLTRDTDSSRVTSLAGYGYGKTQFVYDLSPGGEAAADAVATLEEGLRRIGGLQSVALRQIEEMLAELASAMAAMQPDGERIFALCEDLHNRFKTLTANATAFMAKVNRLLNSPVVAESEFALFKADTITYLSEFLTELDTQSIHIRRRLDELDRVVPDRRAAAIMAGEAASGQLVLDSTVDARTWSQTTELHLAGLADWFRATEGSRTGASVLHGKAREAILGIARVAERIREASASPSSRSADLLALARAFEASADDAAGHLLWHAAFGFSSARHLGIIGPDGVPASTSWWDASSGVPISRQLRTRGRTDYVRRAVHVVDRSAERQMLALAVREGYERSLAATAALTALGPVRLSDLNTRHGEAISHEMLRLMAHLLFRALRAPRGRDGRRTACSLDGTLHITVVDPTPPRAARLVAQTGIWTLADFTVTVENSERLRSVQRSAADLKADEALSGERR